MTLNRLRYLMRARMLLDLEMERYRRELATSKDNENSPMWFKMLNECEEERRVIEERIAHMLPSGTYKWDHKRSK